MPLAGNRKEDSMTQAERLTFLIEYLMSENKELKSFHIPVEENAKKRLLRSLIIYVSICQKPISQQKSKNNLLLLLMILEKH